MALGDLGNGWAGVGLCVFMCLCVYVFVCVCGGWVGTHAYAYAPRFLSVCSSLLVCARDGIFTHRHTHTNVNRPLHRGSPRLETAHPLMKRQVGVSCKLKTDEWVVVFVRSMRDNYRSCLDVCTCVLTNESRRRMKEDATQDRTVTGKDKPGDGLGPHEGPED